MARENNTPVPFWLSIPLREFGKWVIANNEIVQEQREKQKHKG